MVCVLAMEERLQMRRLYMQERVLASDA